MLAVHWTSDERSFVRASMAHLVRPERSRTEGITMVRIGVWVQNRGELPRDPGIAQLARTAEAAGFDNLSVSDHVVMPEVTRSPYPFSEDGVATWDPRDPWYDPIVAMTVCAAVTTRPEIGVGVLVLPQRHPIVLAKQLASLDVISGGRLMIGIGAGWLAEEFAALGVPFSGRGRRMDEWITLLRDQWTGEPPAFDGEHYQLPTGVLAYPRPAHRIPLLVGGMSGAALRRAADADGWFALQRVDALDPEEIRAGVAAIAERRDPADGPARVLLRVIGDPDAFAGSVTEFMAAGVTDIVVNADLTDDTAARRTYERLRDAADG